MQVKPKKITNSKDRMRLYREVFSSEHGELVLRDLLAHCHMGQNPFNPDSARQTDYNLGRQEVGQYVTNTMENKDARSRTK